MPECPELPLAGAFPFSKEGFAFRNHLASRKELATSDWSIFVLLNELRASLACTVTMHKTIVFSASSAIVPLSEGLQIAWYTYHLAE